MRKGMEDREDRLERYSKIFQDFVAFVCLNSRTPTISDIDADAYEISLCKVVSGAVEELRRDDNKPVLKKDIVREAMRRCGGSLNPGWVEVMVEAAQNE